MRKNTDHSEHKDFKDTLNLKDTIQELEHESEVDSVVQDQLPTLPTTDMQTQLV